MSEPSNLEEEITKLTGRYYELVNRDHHKDRDCHFSIDKHWQYGDAPFYRVEHQGYISEWDGPDSFPTAAAAHEALAGFLREIVDAQEKFDPNEAWS